MRLLIIILTVWTGIATEQRTVATKNCQQVIDSLTNRKIYNNVDVQPKVVGGIDKLYTDLATLRIPKDPDVDQIKITISFIVESNGEITGLKTFNKIKSTTLDNELLQLLRKHTWEPATCKGTKVPTRLALRVVS
jgi:hypothetical protein